MVGRSEVDFTSTFAASVIVRIDAGDPIVVLTGLHSGCYELFATERVRTISDLKGKRVAVPSLGSSPHLYLSIVSRHVGLDPRSDIEWVTPPGGNALELFAAGKADAFLGFPPEPQELRARGIGRVILRHWNRTAVVSIFLLHVACKQELRQQLPDRDQTHCAGHYEGHRLLRR